MKKINFSFTLILALILFSCQDQTSNLRQNANTQSVPPPINQVASPGITLINKSHTCSITLIEFLYQNPRNDSDRQRLDVLIQPQKTLKIALPPPSVYKKIQCDCVCNGKKKSKVVEKNIFQVTGSENATYEITCD